MPLDAMAAGPELILHIGTEKTGTTSIQEFLRLNAATLMERGFHVPLFLGAGNHRWGVFIAEKEDRVDYFSRGLGLAEDVQRRNQVKAEKTRELLEAAQQISDRRWIISSEHFQSRLTTAAEVRRLREILEPAFRRIRIVLYCRDPLQTAISSWGTSVMAGSPDGRLGKPGEVAHHNCDHRDILERWLSVFERDQFCVRLFEPRRFVGADLIQDFCAVAGIPLDPAFVMPERMNPSLSHQAIRLLAHVNREIPRLIDGRPNPLRRNLADYVRRHFNGLPAYVPLRSEVESFRACYHDSSEWLRREFFPDLPALWSTPACREEPDAGDSEELSPLERSFVACLVAVWSDTMTRLRDLEQQVCPP